MRLLLILLLIAIPLAPARAADALKVAVAANFKPTLEVLAKRYRADGGVPITISSASTGVLYAQISQGAPFDVFLAADAKRPEHLVGNGHAVADSRFTYAIGRLALVSRRPVGSDAAARAFLTASNGGKVAIANPDTAPYGAAAMQALKAMKLEREIAPRLVRGQNVAQTLQLFTTHNTTGAFVSLAQAMALHCGEHGSDCAVWRVPAKDYRPLQQQAVLVAHSAHAAEARRFLAFLRSKPARKVIEAAGYGTVSGLAD